MSGELVCCPACSIMWPEGVTWTNDILRGAFAQPTLQHGRRSGKFWLIRPSGCKHGPVSEENSHVTASTISGPWNSWATKEANDKADRMGWTGDRRAAWLKHLGL